MSVCVSMRAARALSRFIHQTLVFYYYMGLRVWVLVCGECLCMEKRGRMLTEKERETLEFTVWSVKNDLHDTRAQSAVEPSRRL